MKNHILVTGGAGYIGSHTVLELINAGYEPLILDNFSNSSPKVIAQLEEITGRKIEAQQVDCSDYNSLLGAISQFNKPLDGVIHFAAFKAVGESVLKPLRYYQNNVGSLLSVLQLCKNQGITKIVFSSSCTIYGESDIMPVVEHTPAKEAASPYGDTKQQCESILRNSYKALGMRVSVLRYFNPIGAHPEGLIGELPKGIPNNLVPYIQQTAAGKRETITVHGNDYDTPDGTCIRDYIDVNDLARAHILAFEHLNATHAPVIETYNLGTGKGHSVLEVIHAFIQANSVQVMHQIGSRRAGDVPVMYADSTKAKKELGWQPEYSLEDSLRHAWKWQQYHDENW